MLEPSIEELREFFAKQSKVELALLFGSRTQPGPSNDWDFAVQFFYDPEQNLFKGLAEVEKLRAALRHRFAWSEEEVDLVNIRLAGLSIRHTIVEDGIALKGQDRLSLIHFYLKTWFEEEMFYWQLNHGVGSIPERD